MLLLTAKPLLPRSIALLLLLGPPWGDLLSPGTHSCCVRRTESCLWMNEVVLQQRHLAVFCFFADLAREFLPLLLIVSAPLGQVQCIAPIVHITRHQPGCRCHVAVPGPYRPIRMAVIARTFQHGRDILVSGM